MEEKTLIQNGVIIDGTGTKPKKESILIDNCSIKATGKDADKLADSNDVIKIDAAGKTIMPGLIDAHIHVTFDEPSSNDELFFHRREALSAIIAAYNAKKVLCAGVTGFCDPDSLHSIGVDLRDAIKSGYVEGPRMSVGGNALLTSVGGTAGRLIPDEGLRGYAKIVQNNSMVPMVEPEVLMDGDHSVQSCFEATAKCLKTLFSMLDANDVSLKGTILKPNMVVSGTEAPIQASVSEVAELTLKVLKENVPSDLAGIAFLSGGQSDLLATEHLDAMNKLGKLPWPLSFSYGRALQQPALKAWMGQSDNKEAAQKAFSHRALMNKLASKGEWQNELET